MKNLFISIRFTLAACLLLAIGYVLILQLTAWIAGPNHGQADTITVNNKVVGATNVGQTFTNNTYFWSRPSAVQYNASAAGGSNKATTNPEYLNEVETRIQQFLTAHPYLSREDIPSEMVTASGSGLDPHISIQGAVVQAKRIAQARHMPESQILSIIREQTEQPWLGLFGTAKINVLKLNIALDKAQQQAQATTNQQTL